jgi:DNA processing protein
MLSSDLPLTTPAGLLGLMRLPGVGPAKALAHARGEQTLDELDEDSLRRAIESASAQVGEYEKAGVMSLGQFDAGFPTGLSTIPGAPAVVFVRGQPTAWERPALAVVGTRSPSCAGEETTRSLTFAAVEAGFAIISGLALGIDAIAHVSALEGGGRTTGVLGSGLDSITPKQHGMLADRILRSDGALLSEQPFGTAPSARTLVARNRLQAGLAQAVLVGEAGTKSGTMHTVRFAAEQGKPIYCAVPHSLGDASAGVIALLETPAQALPSVLPAWANATGLAARLGTSPLARPVRSNGLEAWLLGLQEDARSVGTDADGGTADGAEEQLRLNGV